MSRYRALPWNGKVPRLAPDVWIADGVCLIGDVSIGSGSSVWFNSVVRADVHWIRIGEGTNIQDLCVLHVTHERFPLSIGNNVTVGHRAIVHGARIEDYVLIGMGACVLDGAHIEPYSIVAAGAVVRPGMHVPSGVLVAGVPARIVRELAPEERKQLEWSAQHYRELAAQYRQAASG